MMPCGRSDKVTSKNVERLSNPSTSQYQEWRRKNENHEQVAVGEKSERRKQQEEKKMKADKKKER